VEGQANSINESEFEGVLARGGSRTVQSAHLLDISSNIRSITLNLGYSVSSCYSVSSGGWTSNLVYLAMASGVTQMLLLLCL
jgi:hypothetical protein